MRRLVADVRDKGSWSASAVRVSLRSHQMASTQWRDLASAPSFLLIEKLVPHSGAAFAYVYRLGRLANS